METDKPTILQSFKFPEWKIAAIYMLSTILVVVPYYNWLYRNIVNSLNVSVFLVSVLAILFAFFKHITKPSFKRSLASLALGVVIVGVGFNIQDWRYALTDSVIKENYCNLNSPAKGEYFLGGIKEIRLDGSSRRTGAFGNSSSCLTDVCTEEFYYCRESAGEAR